MFDHEWLPRRWPSWCCRPQVEDDNDNDADAHSSNNDNNKNNNLLTLPPTMVHVILFFDVGTEHTLAVLSSSVEGLVSQHLQCRVAQGTARCLNPLYYELDGFLRENWSQLRHQKGLGTQFTVNIAVGALDTSDKAQSTLLEQERKASTIRLSLQTPPELKRGCDASVHADKSTSQDERNWLFEMALEICRLHGIGDDLDVFSIYCLGQTGNRTLRRLALRLATQRVHQARLHVIPLVDGCPIRGNSTFVRLHSSQSRSNPNQETCIQYERDQFIEYIQCPRIALTPLGGSDRDQQQAHSSISSISGNNNGSNSNICNRRNVFVPVATEDDAIISWSCIENAFSLMEQWWGDGNEYAGQKLQVRWQPDDVDIVVLPSSKASNNNVNNNGTEQYQQQPLHVDLASVYIQGELPKHKCKRFVASRFCSCTLHVIESHVTQKFDDLATYYHGSVQLVQVDIDFRALVRAHAKSLLLPSLMQRHARIEEKRPLLTSEREYFHLVERAAAPTFV